MTPSSNSTTEVMAKTMERMVSKDGTMEFGGGFGKRSSDSEGTNSSREETIS